MPEFDWCFRPRFCTERLYWAGTTWANEMNFVMNHSPGVGSIAQPVDLQSNTTMHCATDAPYISMIYAGWIYIIHWDSHYIMFQLRYITQLYDYYTELITIYLNADSAIRWQVSTTAEHKDGINKLKWVEFQPTNEWLNEWIVF